MEIVVAVSTPTWMHCLEHLVLVCLVFMGPTSTEHQKTHRIMSCLKIIRSIVYIGCQKGPFLILIPFFSTFWLCFGILIPTSSTFPKWFISDSIFPFVKISLQKHIKPPMEFVWNLRLNIKALHW